ncbi:uncharacterized protein LOC143878275 [Tasmannia lanceolata]|uniref:uncharacterized protein LOC143878275 n=1 Tax=Tasmannia lanceolata TaxID=3420 RepID=UPI0040636BCC
MNKDSRLSDDVQFGINLEVLESDLQAALTALRKNEENLQDAEMMVLLDHVQLNHAKWALEQWKEEIAAVYAKKEKIEEDLMKANEGLVSQARQIKDLKLLVEERDREIASAKSLLSLKEDELNSLKNELMMKNEEANRFRSDLESRDQLLIKVNEVIQKQEAQVQDLQRFVRERQHELVESVQMRKVEEENLKVAEVLRKADCGMVISTGRAEETG